MPTFKTNPALGQYGYPVIAGNFARTSTVAGRAMTLLLMWRGRFPGQNPGDEPEGNSVWEDYENVSESEDTIEGVKQGHADALAPMLRDGSLSSVNVTDELRNIGGQQKRVFIISSRSSIGADPEDIVLLSPWLLNVAP